MLPDRDLPVRHDVSGPGSYAHNQPEFAAWTGRPRRKSGPDSASAFLCDRQTQIQLIYQGSGLKCVSGLLAAHVITCHAMQFGVDERHQFIESRLVAIAPLDQQLSD